MSKAANPDCKIQRELFNYPILAIPFDIGRWHIAYQHYTKIPKLKFHPVYFWSIFLANDLHLGKGPITGVPNLLPTLFP